VDFLVSVLPAFGRGFANTVYLTVLAGVVATALGTVIAGMRVSPVPVLQRAGALYVNIVRNTPLTVVFVFAAYGLPKLDVQFQQFEAIGLNTFFVFALIALSVYTAAFVAEAIRSGINSVAPGQAEAGRAVGMTFLQNLRLIVLPQAVRAVLPPLASVYIALLKNTAIAEFFGVVEATAAFDTLTRDNPDKIYQLFVIDAAGYILLVLVISAVFALLERKMRVAR
jgi:glutamate transport system permease protein